MEPSVSALAPVKERVHEVGDRVRLHPDASIPGEHSSVAAHIIGGVVVAVYDYPEYDDVPTLFDVEFGPYTHPYTGAELVAVEAVAER